jgi:hypothetical protein
VYSNEIHILLIHTSLIFIHFHLRLLHVQTEKLILDTVATNLELYFHILHYMSTTSKKFQIKVAE